MTQDALLSGIKAYQPELVAIRQDIHRHPEVGFEETRTAALVADRLRAWGLKVSEGIAGTGVVATLKGRLPGQRAIGLRADLDALYIQEVAGRAHGSQVPGKMHACGHDGHTTMLLGAARYLAEHPDFGGTVQFIFQRRERDEAVGGQWSSRGCSSVFQSTRYMGCTTCREFRWVRSRPGRARSWRRVTPGR